MSSFASSSAAATDGLCGNAGAWGAGLDRCCEGGRISSLSGPVPLLISTTGLGVGVGIALAAVVGAVGAGIGVRSGAGADAVVATLGVGGIADVGAGIGACAAAVSLTGLAVGSVAAEV